MSPMLFRVSTSTDITSVSRQHLKNRRRKRRMPRQIMSRVLFHSCFSKKLLHAFIFPQASSVSSITESSMSLNIITVTLNMGKKHFIIFSRIYFDMKIISEAGNFLGISIVGHSDQLGGDGGIYVGSIMKG